MSSSQNLQGITAHLRSQTETSGKTVAHIWKNKKVFFISSFASFGGLLYGYQQGVLGQAVVMHSFKQSFPDATSDSAKLGWLTSVLQLGGWVGSLSSGVFAQVFSRKHTMFVGALWVVLGSFLAAGAQNIAYLYAGRLFTGLGVGTLSAIGPLYNAELSPPEMRGFIIALQQLTTTIGIMLAYWVAYGSNYIGGTGEGQSNFAWRLPMIIQGVPAVCLAVGILFMPFSPRLLAAKGRDDEAVKTISYLRNLPEDNFLVRAEFLEIKADVEFEKRTFDKLFPTFSANSVWRREFAQYSGLIRNKDAFKRVSLASLVMFFQQWTGIDSNPPSHLLRPHHLSISRPHQQHLLSPRHRRHRHHQRRHHHPRHHLHRQNRPQAADDGRLGWHVHLRSCHRHHCGQMRARLDAICRRGLGRRRFRLVLYHQLRLLLGPRVLDPHRRNLPAQHSRQGHLYRRVCQRK
ncbi:Sugar/inositol transporter [Macrophomina phaseolina MS6]|uniref:Sugar/inositol transporter n=1 Tax=Macrophomina phaseolina (strain MS6) TaxID=1126212 RepID=K2RFN5_MACPH|nr:Sugar/inositol transporter [Macrophomina phaseolina MS6]